jgi:hypothetical protein
MRALVVGATFIANRLKGIKRAAHLHLFFRLQRDNMILMDGGSKR